MPGKNGVFAGWDVWHFKRVILFNLYIIRTCHWQESRLHKFVLIAWSLIADLFRAIHIFNAFSIDEPF